MIKKYHIILCYIVSILILTDSLFATFRRGLGRIRKRKSVALKENNNAVESVGKNSLEMYYTRRTTPWPRMQITLDPKIEAYYSKKDTKEHLIKQVYFKKAKMKQKGRKPIKTAFSDMYKAPALD